MKIRDVSLIAGVTGGPVAAALAIVFVVGGILIATDGAGRWSPPLSRTLSVAGEVIIIAFGVLLVVQALV